MRKCKTGLKSFAKKVCVKFFILKIFTVDEAIAVCSTGKAHRAEMVWGPGADLHLRT